MGTKKRPFYRIVVSDSHVTPSARVLETLGHYDPQSKPSRLDIDVAKAEAWIGKGARASETVSRLIRREKDRVRTAAAGA